MYNNNNAQQLNITTIINNENINDGDDNVLLINTMFNNNINNKNRNKYKINKYLGEGIQGSLYMASDANNNKYICKKINIVPEINPNQLNQLNFELNLLKYLSSNKVTREYINPCLEYKIINNQVLTLFPIFNGYSLNHIKKYLLKMKHKNYYKILFHLIKVTLHGMAKIHQNNIAHQNINENSILVSTYTNNDEIKVKFTDFGLGCGLNNLNYNINTCNVENPTKITNSIIKKMSKSNNLFLAKKNDILYLCTIFIKLLLFFENIELDLSQGYNDSIKEYIKKLITEKFLSQLSKYQKVNYSNDYDSLKYIKSNYETKRDILEYLNILNNYVLCESQRIESCQYILDKLIIYEKYKNNVF